MVSELWITSLVRAIIEGEVNQIQMFINKFKMLQTETFFHFSSELILFSANTFLWLILQASKDFLSLLDEKVLVSVNGKKI